MGHGHYATKALTEAVAENKGLHWLTASPERIAEQISASLFVRGFFVIDEDFLRMARGEEPENRTPEEAHRKWLARHET